MALDLTVKTDPPEPLTGVQIFIGYKRPKNWLENSYKRKDQTYQKMAMEWLKEDDPAVQARIWEKMEKYWARRRKELGFTEPEEAD